MMMMPTGFRFSPTDEELIDLLERKISGQEMHLHDHFLIERDVYEIDPQHLQWDDNVGLLKNERYYYCLKENDSREVVGRGWWRATGHVNKIYLNDERRHLVGYKRPLTFHRFRDDHHNKNNRKKAIKTNWIMHEYGLESWPREWRLCKIKYKGKPSAQEELENVRKASSSSSTSTVAEQQRRPQTLQLENHVCDHEPYYYSESNFSDFSSVENQQQQQQTLQFDNNVYETYNNVAENVQIEAIDVEQQQPPEASYDPYYSYYIEDNHQLEQASADLSEQIGRIYHRNIN